MTINSETLKRLRAGMSQDQLSKISGVDKKTIQRIETGKTKSPDAITVERLAKALNRKPEDLSEEPDARKDDKKYLRNLEYRPIKTYLDGETALAFEVVEQLYGISVRSQILMAPLFSALLAEGSLAWRREQLSEIKDSAERLISLGGGHLSFAFAAERVENGAKSEAASIDARDFFGKDVGEEAFELGYDPSQNNPFADYLKDFAKRAGAKDIVFDPDDSGEWKTAEGLPEYRIADDFFNELTGGDYWAEFALKRGHARIREIPEELKGADAKLARVDWLTSKVPVEERTIEYSDIDVSLLD